ncbi:glycosyltransferase family 25 protein [Anatilimnocola floriformis]|uniref:glycosyltransferase family 25 protein n=1 Tax=Anatilimnocola floriformis TaxID=2948575 RepID=UPI0020C4B1C4|nr:glycosyltransferase family 25 protein [Anatilimnocola floriformis]
MKTYLINLARREDRLKEFADNQIEHGWPCSPVTVVKAVDGTNLPLPRNWKANAGAWGCRQSHIRVIEDALANNEEQIFVLEDDVCWTKDIWPKLEIFCKNVPHDWDMLFLGGQHILPPKLLWTDFEWIFRGRYVCRTHAYVLPRRTMPTILRLLYATTDHIDHAIGKWCALHKVYCPEQWLFGQRSSLSDIGPDGIYDERMWNELKSLERNYI